MVLIGMLAVACTTPTPAPVSFQQRVVRIAAAWTHSCAITGDGRVQCWGNNQDGQLGDGSRAAKAVPEPVVGLLGSARDVTVGERHTCILTAGGGVKCWGSNQEFQLGDGTRVDRVSPAEVTGLSGGVRMVAAGERHTCVLTMSHAVRCWGSNRYGQLGDGTYEDRPHPVDVSGLNGGVRAIAAGWRHTCALTQAGAVVCWGNNKDGQLGDRTLVSKLIPVNVTGLDGGVVMIAAGGRHTCASLATGAVACWGDNERGQLGDGTTESRSVPTPVVGVTDARAISAGWQHTCVVATSGTVACWGNNEKGQVTVEEGLRRTTPATVAIPTGVMPAAGGHHTCVLTDGGLVRCWGDNEYGQLATG